MLVVAIALVACSKPSPADSSPGDTSRGDTAGTTASTDSSSGDTSGTGTAADTGDTGSAVGFVPYVLFVQGGFGYDASTGQVVSVGYNGYDLFPDIEVYVASKAYFDGYDARELCAYDLPANNGDPVVASTATFDDIESDGVTADEVTALSWSWEPSGFAVGASPSNDPWCGAWDPSFSALLPVDLFEAWQWGLAVGDARGDVAANETTACVDKAGLAVPCVGGGLRWTALPGDPPVTMDGFAVGFEVDDSMAIVEDDSGSAERMPTDEMDVHAGVKSGYYEVWSWFTVEAEGLKPE